MTLTNDLQDLVNDLALVVYSRRAARISRCPLDRILAIPDQINPRIQEASFGESVNAALGVGPTVVEVSCDDHRHATGELVDGLEELFDAGRASSCIVDIAA